MKNWKITLVVKCLNTLSYPFPAWTGQIAFHLFKKPVKGKLNLNDKNFLTNSTISQLIINDLHIQLYDWGGTGETILLAHGWNSNTARWRNLIEVLRGSGFRVVALDAPAHGGSGGVYFDVVIYAQHLQKALQHFNPIAVVGHSAGGMAISYCIKNFKDNAITNLKKIVLMGVPSDLSDLMDNYVQTVGFNERIRKALDQHIERESGEPTTFFSVRRFVHAFPKHLRGLVIHDKNDTIARFDHAKEIHNNWAYSRWFSSENFGHSLQAEVIYKQINSFLKA